MVFEDFALPSWRGSDTSPARKIDAEHAAISQSAPRKPSNSSSSPPTKKPTPFIAFFEPVNHATHLNSWPEPPSPTSP